jgi:hypothetical protein
MVSTDDCPSKYICLQSYGDPSVLQWIIGRRRLILIPYFYWLDAHDESGPRAVI